MLLVEHAHLYTVWRFVECGGCANRPQTRWGPHLADAGSFFTLTLVRPTTSNDPSRDCFIRGHVGCARRPLDKVSDELLLECLPMLAVEGNSVVHPCQLRCHLTLTPLTNSATSCTKPRVPTRRRHKSAQANTSADSRKICHHSSQHTVHFVCDISLSRWYNAQTWPGCNELYTSFLQCQCGLDCLCTSW